MRWSDLAWSADLSVEPVRDRSLAACSRFLVGGPADLFFEVGTREELAAVLMALPVRCPVHVVGLGSNTLFRDGGFRGAVIRLCGDLEKCDVHASSITAAAGCSTRRMARLAARSGVSGFEFLDGIPGTVGGAICMNAGAFDRDVACVVREIEVMYRDGRCESLQPDRLNFAYRHAELPQDAIIIGAAFEGSFDRTESIVTRMDSMDERRRSYQPINARTCGSTFKNPPQDSVRRLIQAAGAHSLRVGGASMSALNCNFMLAGEVCTASDLETLGDEIRSMVRRLMGVAIEWEVCRIGQA
jgi:UDP-N-acetylmuramate dehydrogenase